MIDDPIAKKITTFLNRVYTSFSLSLGQNKRHNTGTNVMATDTNAKKCPIFINAHRKYRKTNTAIILRSLDVSCFFILMEASKIPVTPINLNMTLKENHAKIVFMTYKSHKTAHIGANLSNADFLLIILIIPIILFGKKIRSLRTNKRKMRGSLHDLLRGTCSPPLH